MGVRKIETIKSINDLNLDSKSVNTIAVHGYTISVLITAARYGNLEKLDRIGAVTAERILKAIDEAGFIFHESAMSERIRDLLVKTFGDLDETIEEYEARTEFTEAQRDELFRVFENLTEKESETLKMRFGLKGDAAPMSLERTAAEFGVTRERVRALEAKALRKLRHPSRRGTMKAIFSNWYGLAKDTHCDAGAVKYEGPIEEMPLTELPALTVRAYNCLCRAGIWTVGQLMNRSYEDVKRIRNMTKDAIESIITSLSAIGLALKEKDDEAEELIPEEKSPV